MKNSIDIFVELGERLSKGVPTGVLTEARNQNKWFTYSDIELAIEAIRKTMLGRNELEEWVSQYHTASDITPQRVLIVMAGNIPLVGFFDLLCVLISGNVAIVKPSHKDRTLTEWVIGELREIEPEIPIYMYSEGDDIDRVIATGGDAAVRHFGEKFREIPTLLRGSRHSIAVIDNNTPKDEDLLKDIYSYSGLGCRNVSLIFAPRGYRIPTTPTEILNQKYINNYLNNRALLTISETPHIDNGASCILRQERFPLQLSSLSVVEYDSIAEVERWIESQDDELQCIVANSDTITHPRRVDFGRAQYPTLYDYADGVDTMIFLTQNL